MVTKHLWHMHRLLLGTLGRYACLQGVWHPMSTFLSMKRKNQETLLVSKSSGVVKDCDSCLGSLCGLHYSCFSFSFLLASTSQGVVSFLGLRNISFMLFVFPIVLNRRLHGLMDIWGNPMGQQYSWNSQAARVLRKQWWVRLQDGRKLKEFPCPYGAYLRRW